ncbi:hypothetical protein RvY_06182 [Ramazzottius varieornatus]|uniref:Uncharacterized protein n=1 Tax=Ramazzottius varieornatus TaxID=947166 RepID=A0A1D1V6H2_RAMVA|nr:hypothetical protein RvY_06182 [Ramazzottius varieornatus]
MDESIAVDGSDAHNLSIAETSSSGKPRRDFSLEEEIALCNEIEEKKPIFNTAQAGWKNFKIAMDAFNGSQREVRCYNLRYDNLLKMHFSVCYGKANDTINCSFMYSLVEFYVLSLL